MKTLVFLLLGAFFVISLSCGGNEIERTVPKHPRNPVIDENWIKNPYGLSKEEQEEWEDLRELMEWLDQFPVVKIDTNAIKLPSGRMWNEVNSKEIIEQFQRLSKVKVHPSPNNVDMKDAIVKDITREAELLTERTNFIKVAGTSRNEPAQPHGLAYVFGSKDIVSRNRWTSPTTRLSPCPEFLYGLDCSGYIYQAFRRAGLTTFPSGNANHQRQTSTIEDAIKSKYPNLKIKVEDLDRLPVDSLDVGDIVYFKRADGTAYHIGMIVSDSRLAHSAGHPDSCSSNMGPISGPLIKNIESTRGWLGSNRSNYGVVRIIPEEEKEEEIWTLYIRVCIIGCLSQNTEFSFVSTEDFEKQITVISVDINNRPHPFVFRMKYYGGTRRLEYTVSYGEMTTPVSSFVLVQDNSLYSYLDGITNIEGTHPPLFVSIDWDEY